MDALPLCSKSMVLCLQLTKKDLLNGPNPVDNPVDTVQNYTDNRDLAMMVKKHIFTINTRSYLYPISTIKSLPTMQGSQMLGKA
jgi:hypothetical protein